MTMPHNPPAGAALQNIIRAQLPCPQPSSDTMVYFLPRTMPPASHMPHLALWRMGYISRQSKFRRPRLCCHRAFPARLRYGRCQGVSEIPHQALTPPCISGTEQLYTALHCVPKCFLHLSGNVLPPRSQPIYSHPAPHRGMSWTHRQAKNRLSAPLPQEEPSI